MPVFENKPMDKFEREHTLDVLKELILFCRRHQVSFDELHITLPHAERKLHYDITVSSSGGTCFCERTKETIEVSHKNILLDEFTSLCVEKHARFNGGSLRVDESTTIDDLYTELRTHWSAESKDRSSQSS